jgi:hypothetical protein
MASPDTSVQYYLDRLSLELGLLPLEVEAIGKMALTYAQILTGLTEEGQDSIAQLREPYAKRGLSYDIFDYLDDMLDELAIYGLMAANASGSDGYARDLNAAVEKNLGNTRDMDIAKVRMTHLRIGGRA